MSVNDAGLPRRYQLQQAAPSAQVVQVNPTDRTLTFPTLPGAQADIYASYWVPAPKLRRITLRSRGNVQEVYMVPSIAYLVQRLQDENSPSSALSRLTNLQPLQPASRWWRRDSSHSATARMAV